MKSAGGFGARNGGSRATTLKGVLWSGRQDIRPTTRRTFEIVLFNAGDFHWRGALKTDGPTSVRNEPLTDKTMTSDFRSAYQGICFPTAEPTCC